MVQGSASAAANGDDAEGQDDAADPPALPEESGELEQVPSSLDWSNIPGAYRVFGIGPAEAPGEGPPPADAHDATDEESPPVHVPNAILVEEEEVYHGTPLEPPVPHWRQNGIRNNVWPRLF